MTRLIAPSALRWTFDDYDMLQSMLKNKRLKKHGYPGALGQEGALMALELGLGIKERGFNLFVVGASGTGRTSTVRQVLRERAATESAPDDVVLLYNFDDRDRPLAVTVPAGQGPGVKKRYDALVDKFLGSLEKAFEADAFTSRRSELDDEYRRATDAILSGIEEEAEAAGFMLTRSGAALTLAPRGEDGQPITQELYDNLPPEARAALESNAERLEARLEDGLRRVRQVERDADEAIENLARTTAEAVIGPVFDSTKNKFKNAPRITTHLDACREDVLNRLRRLFPEHRGESSEDAEGPIAHSSSHRLRAEEEDSDHDEPALLRYRVNVLVTHKPKGGAPVVQETHPTTGNIIGRLEHRVRGGETTTDFTRIKAGALYRANGGYLLIEARELLRDPTAWEGLKRALKNRAVELDDPGEQGRLVTVTGLRPEPVPLKIKVCLVGTPDIYYALAKQDPDFSKLFKVKVDFEIEMDRSEDRIRSYVRFMIGVAYEEKLRPLTAQGAARVLEHAARIAEHQGKLTARFGEIADLVREANFWAIRAKKRRIDAPHVQEALARRAERNGFVEKRILADIAEGRLLIPAPGMVKGQTVGLTVLQMGTYAFGLPARITSRVGAGKGALIDIEREAELGGPLHTKGTLILRGYLQGRFGERAPLGFQATVCIEQNHSDIDGDSASLAESCALLSALSDVPLDQSIAMTGAIDQDGRVHAVGGVNEKIEGFFKVSKQRRDQGPFAVMIPESNARDLMLDAEVVQAAEDGWFTIHTVSTIADAMEKLSGKAYEADIEAAVLDKLKKLDKLQPHARRVY